MKKISVLVGLLFCLFVSNAQTENWMTSLDIAKRLARTQNKPILMVWEEATLYPLPVLVATKNRRNIVVSDLFSSIELNKIVWEYFVPVKVNEILYEDLYNEIKDKRSSNYINSFNDDSLKVMDANGVILGTSGAFTELLNFTNFISRYALDTSFLEQELRNYENDKNFYSTFYLGSKYIDYSIFMDKTVRSQILEVSNIYLDDAEVILEKDTKLKEKSALRERLVLTRLLQELVKNNSRRVLRQLKKMDATAIEGANKSLLNYLYYTAYRLRSDTEEFKKIESEISLANIKQAQQIVNINR